LHVETATLFLHLDSDFVPLQSSEFLGQSGVGGCETDAGIAGISQTQVFSVTGVVAIVVRYIECFLVKSEGEIISILKKAIS